MSYQYCQEARDRISALGQTAVNEFIEEVPHAIRKSFYDRQPAIPGFRRGTPLEFREKQRRLVGHIIHPQTGAKGDADWKLFAHLWEAWAKSCLDSGFPVSDKPTITLDTGSIFLKRLAELFPDAPREVVDRLIQFSGFADHPDTQAALERFHPASTLARDRMIDGLPARLHKIEGYVEIAETAAEEVANRIDQLELQSASLIKNIEEVASSVRIVNGGVAELRNVFDSSTARTEGLEEAIRSQGSAGKSISESITASEIQAKLVAQSLKALSSRADGWDESSAKISGLREAVDQIISYQADLTEVAAAIDVLSDRMKVLESNLAKVGNGSIAKQQIRLFETEPNGPLVRVLSVDTACELIACNLQACGIVKGAATATARHILAALIAGQVVQFTGSLADLVADAVAASVGGPVFHEWRVPVGLTSDEAATDCLDVVAESSGCLLMKGANRSAFEVYGTAVRDVVARRQFSMPAYHRLSIIASWAQGPAAFPDGGTLAELGPVFDTDTLPMRGVSAKLPGLKFGNLASDFWDQIQDLNDNSPRVLVAELRDSLKEANFAPGNFWMRIADRAYGRLRILPGGSTEEDLHSLLMFWAFPWAKANAGPAGDIARIAGRILSDTQTEATHFEGV